jgi:hypothetical protein
VQRGEPRAALEPEHIEHRPVSLELALQHRVNLVLAHTVTHELHPT